MKKMLTWIFVLTFVLALLVYQAHSLSKPHVSDLLIEEHGNLFLLLPISNKKVSVYGSRSDLEKADLDLLRAAEEKIWDKYNSYSEKHEPYFIVYAKDGQVTLHAELIVHYDPPRIPTGTASTDPTAYTPPQSG